MRNKKKYINISFRKIIMWIIIAILMIFIIANFLPMPVSHDDSKIETEQNMIGLFIRYEEAFYVLNQKNLDQQNLNNKLEDDNYLLDNARTILLINLSRASYSLNKMIDNLVQNYPFLEKKVKDFHTWQASAEKKVIQGKHLYYWQVPLLTYQLQMVDLLNDEYSVQNWKIEKDIKNQKLLISSLSLKKQCELLHQFGKSSSPKLLGEQLAILTNHPLKCESDG